MKKYRSRSAGFTLVELAVVLAVAATLVVSGLRWLDQVRRQSELQQAQAHASAARTALLSFALANSRLPCPDMVGDGLETNCNSGNSSLSTIGWLPVVTLGMSDRAANADLYHRPQYGVYRTSALDLAKPVAGPRIDEGRVQAFFDVINSAMALPPTQQLPYLVARSSECLDAQANVAFVVVVPMDALRWEPGSATNCFLSTDPLASEQLGSLLSVISKKS